jgi:hypothetical protein
MQSLSASIQITTHSLTDATREHAFQFGTPRASLTSLAAFSPSAQPQYGDVPHNFHPLLSPQLYEEFIMRRTACYPFQLRPRAPAFLEIAATGLRPALTAV